MTLDSVHKGVDSCMETFSMKTVHPVYMYGKDIEILVSFTYLSSVDYSTGRSC